MIFVLLFLLCVPAAGATTTVVFRYDDFAGDGPHVRNTNELRRRVWQAEQRADAAFAEANLPYSVAVIPLANPHYAPGGLEERGTSLKDDAEKLRFLQRGVAQNRIEVTQHGLSHINYCAADHRPAEFRERDYQEQFRDIVQGRDILEDALGMKIQAFVPPWNGWDGNTARALVAAGFQILSADRYYYYHSAEDLRIIPCTTTLHRFERLVSHNALADPGLYVVLYHPFSLVKYPTPEVTSYYSGLQRFEELIARIAKMPHVKVTTLTDLASGGRANCHRYISANLLGRQHSFWRRLLPEEYRPGEKDQPRYLPTADSRRQVGFWRIMTAVMVCALAAAGLLMRYLIGLRVSSKGLFLADMAGLLFLLVGAASEIHLAQRGYHITGIRAIPLFFASGFMIPTVSRFLKRRRSDLPVIQSAQPH